MSRIRLCTYSRDLQRCQAAANSFVRIADLIILLQASLRSGMKEQARAFTLLIILSSDGLALTIGCDLCSIGMHSMDWHTF